ncbi:hypothetical protein RhiirB3_480318 [Rhizophagus irregularis]|nr:hypothetical protein RhiirB3_480318 [Rhizophagus irregularis]
MGLHKAREFRTSSDFKATGYWVVKNLLRENIICINNENIYKLKLYLVLQESLRLFLDNWMRRTSNVELARIPYNDGRRHGPYESHHLLRHQGIKKTIGYASTLAVLLIKIHVGRKLNAGDTKGVSLEFGKWVYGGGKKLPGFVRHRNAKRDLFCKSEEGT